MASFTSLPVKHSRGKRHEGAGQAVGAGDATTPPWLLLLACVLIAAGIFFRFADYGDKFLWFDESVTLTVISGYRGEDVAGRLSAGEISVRDLREFHLVRPGSGVADVVKELARRDPHLTPLYFVLLRSWVQVFGAEVTSVRALSAVLSLLTLPCLFWLCWEMFQSRSVAWVAMSLAAVSPIHVFYAQEARPYTLWATLVALSSASLLYAVRSPASARAWALYAVTAALGLHAHTFFVPVLFAHGVYVAAHGLRRAGPERPRPTKMLGGFLLASSLALAAFAPWALTIGRGIGTISSNTSWLRDDIDFIRKAGRWVHGLGSVFWDVRSGTPVETFSAEGLLEGVTFLPAAALAVYSIYFVCRRAPRRTWLMVLLLGACVWVPLGMADVILGGRRSTITRYLFPAHIAAQMSVAYMFAAGIASACGLRRRVWMSALGAVIVSGLASCIMITWADTWVHRGSTHLGRVADEINRSESPLLISTFGGTNVGNVLALSHRLDPRVRVRLAPDVSAAPEEANGDLFYFGLSESARLTVEQATRRKLLPVFPPHLWRAGEVVTAAPTGNADGALR